MKRLKEDLKNMLNGLAFENASDFLTRRQKMDVLATQPEKQKENNIINLVIDEQVDDSLETVILEKSAA